MQLGANETSNKFNAAFSIPAPSMAYLFPKPVNLLTPFAASLFHPQSLPVYVFLLTICLEEFYLHGGLEKCSLLSLSASGTLAGVREAPTHTCPPGQEEVRMTLVPYLQMKFAERGSFLNVSARLC